jgi:hypothetical protein
MGGGWRLFAICQFVLLSSSNSSPLLLSVNQPKQFKSVSVGRRRRRVEILLLWLLFASCLLFSKAYTSISFRMFEFRDHEINCHV